MKKTDRPDARRVSWAGCGLVLALIVAYSNSFSTPLVFDGGPHIVDNPDIRDLWSSATRHSRTVPFVSFALNFALHGQRVWGYHAVNLAIHAAATCFLFGIARRTLLLPGLQERYGRQAEGLALAIAALWGLHPLQTQSVTYVYQRYESLMGMFFLATLYCYVRGAVASVHFAASLPAASSRLTSRTWFFLAVAGSALGMGCKEVMATAPVMVLWYDRVFLASSWQQLFRQRGKPLAALAATLLVLVGLIRFHAANYQNGDLLNVPGMTPATYALSQFGAITHYLRLAFWPQGQCIDYGEFLPRSAAEWGPPLAFILALVGLTIWAMFRRPRWGFLGGWFFVILAPSSSIVPIVDLIFEHRIYLSLAAVAAAVVLGSWRLAESWAARTAEPARPRKMLFGLAVGACALLAIATWRRNLDYATEEKLWLDVIAKRPPQNHGRALIALGKQRLEKGENEEALEMIQRGLALDPKLVPYNNAAAAALIRMKRYPEAEQACLKVLADDPHNVDSLCKLGGLLKERQAYAEAHAAFAQAIELNPRHGPSLLGLGNLLLAEDRAQEALEVQQRAVAIDPWNWDGHVDIMRSLRQLGRIEEAVAYNRQALRYAPDDPRHWFAYGQLLERSGDIAGAQQAYAECLSKYPFYAEAHDALGWLQLQQKKYTDAQRSFQTALAVRPDFHTARLSLGVLRAEQGDLAGAVVEFRLAVQAMPQNPQAHVNLARAYRLQGELSQAAAHLAQAMKLQPNVPEIAAQYQEVLKELNENGPSGSGNSRSANP